MLSCSFVAKDKNNGKFKRLMGSWNEWAIMHLSYKPPFTNSINVFKTKQKLSNTFNTLRKHYHYSLITTRKHTFTKNKKQKHIKRIANKGKNMAISQ